MLLLTPPPPPHNPALSPGTKGLPDPNSLIILASPNAMSGASNEGHVAGCNVHHERGLPGLGSLDDCFYSFQRRDLDSLNDRRVDEDELASLRAFANHSTNNAELGSCWRRYLWVSDLHPAEIVCPSR